MVTQPGEAGEPDDQVAPISCRLFEGHASCKAVQAECMLNHRNGDIVFVSFEDGINVVLLLQIKAARIIFEYKLLQLGVFVDGEASSRPEIGREGCRSLAKIQGCEGGAIRQVEIEIGGVLDRHSFFEDGFGHQQEIAIVPSLVRARDLYYQGVCEVVGVDLISNLGAQPSELSEASKRGSS